MHRRLATGPGCGWLGGPSSLSSTSIDTECVYHCFLQNFIELFSVFRYSDVFEHFCVYFNLLLASAEFAFYAIPCIYVCFSHFIHISILFVYFRRQPVGTFVHQPYVHKSTGK